MASRARLLLIASALAPLPLLAAVVWSTAADAARGLPNRVVFSRDGDLYVGANRITDTAADDVEPEWSPDHRAIAFVRREPGRRATSLYVFAVTAAACVG